MGMAIALVLQGGLGFLISLYFTLVYFHRIPANYKLVPPVCRMEDSACQVVLFTRYGSLFGAPNSLFGVMYYILVVVAGFLPLLRTWLLPVSVIVVLLSLYLAYILIARLKVICMLCFASHLINIAVASLLLIR